VARFSQPEFPSGAEFFFTRGMVFIPRVIFLFRQQSSKSRLVPEEVLKVGAEENGCWRR
jgi:hypothetical protein